MKALYWNILSILVVCRTLTAGMSAQDGQPPPPPGKQLCVGFLLGAPNAKNPETGDVFVECSGSTTRLTSTGDVSSWALDVPNSKLLLLRVDRRNDKVSLQVMSLPSRRVEKTTVVESRFRLVPTCGTILLIDRVAKRQVTDAASGRKFPQPDGSTQIRCSADGKTVVSEMAPASLSGGKLLLGSKVLGISVSEFDVSPNGRFVAFNTDGDLCLFDQVSGSKSCLADSGQIGRGAVSNEGVVTLAAQTEQGCPLAETLTTLRIETMWPCPALFEWRPGDRLRLIQFLAVEPQLLPAGIAQSVATGDHSH